MQIYQTKTAKLAGSDFREIHSRALKIYKNIERTTKRRPYIRSRYFNKDKIFLDYFWRHLWQKNWRDRIRRLQYYACALELLRNSKIPPISEQNRNNKSQFLHRFAGMTPSKALFFVQISEDRRNGNKNFLSVFPK